MSAKKKYKVPAGRPRSTPPSEKMNMTGIRYDDHPFVPDGVPFPGRKSSSSYGQAINKIHDEYQKEKGLSGPISLPGPWIMFGELRRRLNCSSQTLTHISRSMTKSGRYEVDDNRFRATKPVKCVYNRGVSKKEKVAAADDPVRDFLEALRQKVVEETDIDVTVEQAVSWFRNKLKAHPELMF